MQMSYQSSVPTLFNYLCFKLIKNVIIFIIARFSYHKNFWFSLFSNIYKKSKFYIISEWVKIEIASKNLIEIASEVIKTSELKKVLP